MSNRQEDGHHFRLEHRRMWRKRERGKIIFCSTFIDDIASASTVLKAGSISEDVKLAVLSKAGSPRKTVADNLVLSGGIDGTGVVSTLGGPHLGKGFGPAEAIGDVVALCVCATPPGQIGDVRMT